MNSRKLLSLSPFRTYIHPSRLASQSRSNTSLLLLSFSFLLDTLLWAGKNRISCIRKEVFYGPYRVDFSEAAGLREILERYLLDLKVEIADTDDKEFRSYLRQRQGLMQNVINRLQTHDLEVDESEYLFEVMP